jgi:hypothetical protein
MTTPTILRWEPNPIRPSAYRLSNGLGSYERRGEVWAWSAGRDYGTAATETEAVGHVLRRLDPATWIAILDDYMHTADHAVFVVRCSTGWEWSITVSAPTRDEAMSEAMQVLAVARRGAP